ncbi:hypothetical protein [Polyangium aurulentum]|uniref:hypothetical protein n=1 Tax=Polyangium aurulentum TaxID=2567896 RepID=UPI0010AE08C4|nr:hypothetical protein [Polyangium aurulentum]UQA60380.1 hypothetical protein E8A73_007870 [Polyangium aurulentum]
MSRVVIGWTAALALATLAAACKDDESPGQPTAPRETAPAPGPSARLPLMLFPTSNPGKPTGALGDTLDAAAGAKGDTPCEQSYATLEAMAAAAEKAGAPAETRKKLRPKDKYLASCKELPEEMQKCLVLGYVMEHGDQCQAAKDKLDAAGQEKLKKLMSGE